MCINSHMQTSAALFDERCPYARLSTITLSRFDLEIHIVRGLRGDHAMLLRMGQGSLLDPLSASSPFLPIASRPEATLLTSLSLAIPASGLVTSK
jgi:hypothetical protein